MTDLLFPGGNNLAGLFLIRCAPVVGLLQLPVPATPASLVVAGPPTFADGYNWYSLYGTEGTKDYDEVQDETDNGPTWTMKLSWSLPGDSGEIRAGLQEMVRHRFVVDCQDNLGVWRRIGTKEQPLQLTYKFDIEAATSGRRGYLITFTGVLSEPPPLVSGI